MTNTNLGIQIAKLQLEISALLVQAVELSDFDKEQGRKRNPDGTWAKSPESARKTKKEALENVRREVKELSQSVSTYVQILGEDIETYLSGLKNGVSSILANKKQSEKHVLDFLKKNGVRDFITPLLERVSSAIGRSYSDNKKNLEELKKNISNAYNKSSIKDAVNSIMESFHRFIESAVKLAIKGYEKAQVGDISSLEKAALGLLGGATIAFGGMAFIGGVLGGVGSILTAQPLPLISFLITATIGDIAVRSGLDIASLAFKKKPRSTKVSERTEKLREENQENARKIEKEKQELDRQLENADNQLRKELLNGDALVVDIDLASLSPGDLAIVKSQVEAYRKDCENTLNQLKEDASEDAQQTVELLKDILKEIELSEKEIKDAEVKQASN